MNQTLIIGSTVVDVLLRIPELPRRGEDINISTTQYRIGGCAYNVFKIMKLFNSPALLCSPVGSGIYGRMVREHLEAEGIQVFVGLEEENGCCYCLVEPDGERSFLSLHGAEYLFSGSWMNTVDFSRIGSIYVSGIEMEEPSGAAIVEFVCEHPEPELYFAPGPRITQIPPDRMESILCRRDGNNRGPFIHLNESEVLQFSGKGRVEEGAEFLAEKTGNSVVITLGERGCYCLSHNGAESCFIPGFPVQVIDTVGAGDSHCGALIACLKDGMNLKEACIQANRAGAAVAAKLPYRP